MFYQCKAIGIQQCIFNRRVFLFYFLQICLASCSSVFIFSSSLLVTVKVYVCLFLLILAVLPLLFCLMLFVLFFDLLYFSAKFSIFTSDVSRLSLYLLLLVYILSDTQNDTQNRKGKTIKTCSQCVCVLSTFASLCVKLRASIVSVSML